MGTAPTANSIGVKMNKFGIVIFIISILLSGLFAVAAAGSSDAEYIAADAEITAETTYDEYYSGYYTCTANIEFRYVAEPFEEGSVEKEYTGTTTGSMESSDSCIDEIEAAFPIGSNIRIFFLSDDPSIYSFDSQTSDIYLYYCCSGFFAILATLGLIVALMMGSKGSTVATGGLSARMGNFRAQLTGQKGKQITPTQSSYQTLPSQQNIPAFNQVRPSNPRRRKRWKDGNMTASRIRNYDSIIGRMGLNNRGFDDVKEAKAHALSYGIMSQRETEEFFANDHVLKTLGLSTSSAFNSAPSQPSEPSGGFWGSQGISTTKAQSSEDTCGHPGCSNTVDSFDFRCFDCRKRFCNTHRGKTFQCETCAN